MGNRPTFQERVWELVREVPPGRVITYGRIARTLGGSHLARTVGYAMARCPEEVPWQRVINAEGRVSERRHPESALHQRHLLESEGVVFDEDGGVDLSLFGFVRAKARHSR